MLIIQFYLMHFSRRVKDQLWSMKRMTITDLFVYQINMKLWSVRILSNDAIRSWTKKPMLYAISYHRIIQTKCTESSNLIIDHNLNRFRTKNKFFQYFCLIFGLFLFGPPTMRSTALCSSSDFLSIIFYISIYII